MAEADTAKEEITSEEDTKPKSRTQPTLQISSDYF